MQQTKTAAEQISMAAFFALPTVMAAQEAQKRNPYGSPIHRLAFAAIKEQAEKHGVAQFIGDY